MNKWLLLLFSLLLVNTTILLAQGKQEQALWLYLRNKIKVYNKWDMPIDLQLRSHDSWNGLRTIQIRTGLAYFVKPDQVLSGGYFYGSSFLTDGKTTTEHRTWEQYNISHKLFRGKMSHRLRLEQRFLSNNNGAFGQRVSYYFRNIQPLLKDEKDFVDGAFLALQNEVFFNVHNKQHFNNNWFDQNQAYAALGYRFSKKVDLEVGYMNFFQKGNLNNTVNNVVQVACYTKF